MITVCGCEKILNPLEFKTLCEKCEIICASLPTHLQSGFRSNSNIWFKTRKSGEIYEGLIVSQLNRNNDPPTVQIRYLDKQWRYENYDEICPIHEVYSDFFSAQQATGPRNRG
jgi:hypothetical protein